MNVVIIIFLPFLSCYFFLLYQASKARKQCWAQEYSKGKIMNIKEKEKKLHKRMYHSKKKKSIISWWENVPRIPI